MRATPGLDAKSKDLFAHTSQYATLRPRGQDGTCQEPPRCRHPRRVSRSPSSHHSISTQIASMFSLPRRFIPLALHAHISLRFAPLRTSLTLGAGPNPRVPSRSDPSTRTRLSRLFTSKCRLSSSRRRFKRDTRCGVVLYDSIRSWHGVDVIHCDGHGIPHPALIVIDSRVARESPRLSGIL